MVGYIYKTTNLITNKFYIGKRQKNNFDKYYYGSGKHLSSSIIKYGKENFRREVIEWCETIEDLNNREKYWISILDARNPLIGYNITEGGDGGGENGKLNKLFCYVHNVDGFIRILKTDKELYLNNGYFSGKGLNTNGLLGYKKSDETKLKISKSNKGKHNHKGEKNPCYGSHYKWINNGLNNKRLDIEKPIPEGWFEGKIQKKPNKTEKSESYIIKLKSDNHWKGDNNPSRKNPKHWYNNGVENIYTCKCPEGFYSGKVNVGKWYNNNIIEKQFKPTDIIPEGFVKGRLKHDRKTD